MYFALGSACLTLLLTHNLRSTISVIIVAGACGIAAGTPLAILGAIGRAAQQGAIVKGGIYLEQLARTDTYCSIRLGGSLTENLGCSRIEPVYGFTEREFLEAAALAERNSEHPLALAIVAAAQEWQLLVPEPSSFRYVPGKGVSARLNGHTILAGSSAWLTEAGVVLPAMSEIAGTHIFVARDYRLIGIIHIADRVRQEAAAAIRELQEMGLRIELLTGDTAASAKAVAENIGVSCVFSQLLPQQKLDRVQELISSGRIVTMIGDGINDAPALAHAHVGVAMGSGTELAHASANILLIGNDLRKFVEALKTARWCRGVIFQNFYGTLIVDAIGIALAAMGLIHPLLAAFIHVSSELAFILNSTRLLPRFTPCAGELVSGWTGA